LEDTAALAGLVFAGTGVSLTLFTGDGRWDAAGSAAIGLLLVAVAAVLVVEMKSLLLGEGAAADQVDAIAQALLGDGVASVIHLRVMHLGPDDLLVAANCEPAPGSPVPALADAIDAAEARARAAVPLRQAIYLEPDLRRSAN
jgi:divalent metal cation (Fe/Co/Zn/Cd) transporter